mmetsp:Transcript_13929/g.33682  ORF Transcript_13929/g.33682 Transcript_13929/m.33682 type:complete len:88 (+) Transcript_13929:63-326(+)
MFRPIVSNNFAKNETHPLPTCFLQLTAVFFDTAPSLEQRTFPVHPWLAAPSLNLPQILVFNDLAIKTGFLCFESIPYSFLNLIRFFS